MPSSFTNHIYINLHSKIFENMSLKEIECQTFNIERLLYRYKSNNSYLSTLTTNLDSAQDTLA